MWKHKKLSILKNPTGDGVKGRDDDDLWKDGSEGLEASADIIIWVW